MIFDVIRELPALDALREDWQQLSNDVPENTGFFASWDYTREYVAFHRPDNWFVVAIRDAETRRLAGVFPLRFFPLRHEQRVFHVCQPIGPGFLPYIEFPVRSQSRRQVLNVLLNEVLGKHLRIDMALFWPLHEASPLYLVLLEDLGRTTQLKTLRIAGNLHEIETRDIDFERYCSERSSKTFKDARYHERRIRKEGTLHFRRHDPDGNIGERVIELCQLSRAKFHEKHLHNTRPEWPAFMATLVTTLAQSGLAEVSTLRFQRQVISSAVSFPYKGRRNFYMFGYDPQYARFSPSKILLAHLIGQSFENREVFCLGTGQYAYKHDWERSIGELKCAFVFLNDAARVAFHDQLDSKSLHRLGVM